MKLESRTTPMAQEISYLYTNNSHIMKILKDSYGSLNKRFNQVPSLGTTSFPGPSIENCHYVLSGNKFVPVPMDISRMQPHVEENMYLKPSPSRNTSQNVLPRIKNNNNPSKFMPLPVPIQSREYKMEINTFPSSAQLSCSSKINEVTVKTKDESVDDKNKKNYQTKTIFCTGTIERLLKWNRSLEDVFCIYETVAPIVALQEGRIKNQKIMLLRDKKGPILQVQYYTSTHIDIDDFYIGQCLRCVGRMIGFNILSAESIREATESEMSTLARLSYVCDYSVTHNLSTA